MEKDKLENIDLSLKLSRFTFLRYSISFIFFISLYWLISSILNRKIIEIIVPTIMSILMLIESKNLFNLLKDYSLLTLENTYKIMLGAGFIISISLIISIFNYELIFSYIKSKYFVIAFLLFLLLVIIISLINLKRIINNKDMVYKQYKKYNLKKKWEAELCLNF